MEEEDQAVLSEVKNQTDVTKEGGKGKEEEEGKEEGRVEEEEDGTTQKWSEGE
jgi:hypothetical protein